MDTSTGELLFAEKLQSSTVEFVEGSDQFSPAWSPDSTMLVFSRGDGRAEANLVLASLDGSAAQILTELPGMETGASWSVNNLIAFTYVDPATGESDLYTVTSKGSNLTLLSGLKGSEYGAAWSPDGLILLFGYGQDSRQIIRLNFNDGSTSSVFKESSQDFDPAWQP
jgi:Tol biopolymer transport system component